MRKLKIFEHISLDGVVLVRGSGKDGDYPYGERRDTTLSQPRWQRCSPRSAWRELRSAAWLAHLRYVVGLPAQGAEQSYI
jgi:hypothetical protein